MSAVVDTVEWCDDDLGELETQPKEKTLLLGLPCKHCGAYDDCQLTECPICGCPERSQTNRSPARPEPRRLEILNQKGIDNHQ